MKKEEKYYYTIEGTNQRYRIVKPKMNLNRKLTKIEREQLKQDCEKLKKRNDSKEQIRNHKTNGLRQYAKIYARYRKFYGRTEAKLLAKWVYENQIK